MEGMHELSGAVAQFQLYTIIFFGLIIFKFKFARNKLANYLPANFLKRKNIVNIHKWISITFLLFLVLHYYTTNKSNVFLLSGLTAASLIPLITGFLLRHKKYFINYYNNIIYAKISIIVIGGILLLIGHSIVD